MKNFVVHDTRLAGNTPSGDFETYEVDGDTPLSQFLTRTQMVAQKYDGIFFLKILAHGFELNGSEGYGIQFCKECIRYDTLWQLYPIKGKVDYIELFSCGAAHYTPGTVEGGYGDGWTLCKRLAYTTGAWVKASTQTQLYSHFNLCPWHWMEIDFGDWEGKVYWFAPDGIGVSQASPQES